MRGAPTISDGKWPLVQPGRPAKRLASSTFFHGFFLSQGLNDCAAPKAPAQTSTAPGVIVSGQRLLAGLEILAAARAAQNLFSPRGAASKVKFYARPRIGGRAASSAVSHVSRQQSVGKTLGRSRIAPPIQVSRSSQSLARSAVAMRCAPHDLDGRRQSNGSSQSATSAQPCPIASRPDPGIVDHQETRRGGIRTRRPPWQHRSRPSRDPQNG